MLSNDSNLCDLFVLWFIIPGKQSFLKSQHILETKQKCLWNKWNVQKGCKIFPKLSKNASYYSCYIFWYLKEHINKWYLESLSKKKNPKKFASFYAYIYSLFIERAEKLWIHVHTNNV